MSSLDKAGAELDAKRNKDAAERRARQQAASAFLFPLQKLKRLEGSE